MTTVEQAQQVLKRRRNELEMLKEELAKAGAGSSTHAELLKQIKVVENLLPKDEQAVAAAQAAAAAPAPVAAAPAAAGQRHTVVAGETLSDISLKYYKTANRWKEIYAANQDVIGENYNLIKPGQVLVIPDAQA